MARKDQLIDMVEFGYQALVDFAESLSADEREASGEGVQWTERDLLAHVVETMRRSARRLTADAHGEAVTPVEDNDAANAEMVARYRGRPWAELRTALDAARIEMLEVMQGLTEEQLNDAQLYPRLQGNAPWNAIMGNALQHPLAFHVLPAYIRRDQGDVATRLAEAVTGRYLALDEAPNWQATALYNLACHYALLGDRATALSKLEAALKLNPGMAEFSRQDPDLESLHGSPEYEALAPAAA